MNSSAPKQSKATTIALDAMGGDYAPEEVVMGAAAVAGPELKIMLSGSRPEIERWLAGVDQRRRDHIEIVEASEVIGFDEEPARAVRAKEDSSLVVACRQVSEGRADAMVSAGNTGAVMAAAMLNLRRIRGLKRPGLCAIIPAPERPTVFIDVGANAEVRPVHLLEFANMASIFAHEVLGVQSPSVGLLSIGEESIKGNDLVLEAHALLASSGHLNFYGNVEGRDIVRGVVDVVVTDGFTGNVCLKLMESTSSMIIEEIRKAANQSLMAKIGGMLLRPRLRQFRRSIDPEEYGGAYLLGVRGLVVICHGNSSRRAIASALKYAARASEHNLVTQLEGRLEALGDQLRQQESS